MARALPNTVEDYRRRAGQFAAAHRARRIHRGPRPGGQAHHRHPDRGGALRRRTVVPSAPGGGWIRTARARARLSPASHAAHAARDVHVHVWPPDAPGSARQLTFRYRLRTNAEDRGRYEDTKRRLAALSWPDMDAYAKAKTAVIEAILASC